MNGASKILTVSYGTFSCTLEGFDDPFNTMRAIAEYFRDLAAEDRFFGAEPPTPDAAMLHKIAEREIQRRVEAKIDGNAVVLRAAHSQTVPEATPSPERAAPRRVEPSLETEEPIAADSVLARLVSLRDAEALNRAPSVVLPNVDLFEESYVEDEPLDVVLTDFPADFPDAAEETIASVMSELHEVVASQNPSELESPTDDVVEDVHVVLDESEASSLAVDARMNAANVSEPVTVEDIEASTDEKAENLPEWQDLVEDDYEDLELVEQIDTAEDWAEDDDVPSVLGVMIDPEGDDTFDDSIGTPLPAEFVAELPEPDAIAPALDHFQDDAKTEEAGSADGMVAEADALERLNRARARVIKVRRIQAAATISEPEPVLEQVIETPTADEQADDRVAALLSPEAEAELQWELAEFEAEQIPAQDAVDLQANDDALLLAISDALPVASSAALPVEGQTSEAQIAEVDVAEMQIDEVQAEETPVAPRLAEAADSDDAVNRLISQTNTVMAGPENKRRLAAIAHLKAAVAATFADRKANAGASEPDTTERMDPYRDDLDRVVRPRRPALVGSSSQPSATGQVAQTPRPQINSRPAPLVLVSEQRINRPAAAPVSVVTPVRPRRVTSPMLPDDRIEMNIELEAVAEEEDVADADDRFGDEAALSVQDVNNIFSDAKQPFAEFAERLGASSMPDILEAAAAYCALQLGRDQFTRPLLMQQIAELPEIGTISREDCLRGFGTLLRNGRIQKVKRGRFRLADHSLYLADSKREAS